MAAVSVTINGVICDLYGRTITGPVKIVGELMYTDRQVGGGPIVPPDQPPDGGNGKPPIDTGAHPSHPIALPGDPWWPQPPINPPDPPTEGKPPPPEGGWGWHPEYGWGYFPMGGGKPQPPG